MPHPVSPEEQAAIARYPGTAPFDAMARGTVITRTLADGRKQDFVWTEFNWPGKDRYPLGYWKPDTTPSAVPRTSTGTTPEERAAKQKHDDEIDRQHRAAADKLAADRIKYEKERDDADRKEREARQAQQDALKREELSHDVEERTAARAEAKRQFGIGQVWAEKKDAADRAERTVRLALEAELGYADSRRKDKATALAEAEFEAKLATMPSNYYNYITRMWGDVPLTPPAAGRPEVSSEGGSPGQASPPDVPAAGALAAGAPAAGAPAAGAPAVFRPAAASAAGQPRTQAEYDAEYQAKYEQQLKERNAALDAEALSGVPYDPTGPGGHGYTEHPESFAPGEGDRSPAWRFREDQRLRKELGLDYVDEHTGKQMPALPRAGAPAVTTAGVQPYIAGAPSSPALRPSSGEPQGTPSAAEPWWSKLTLGQLEQYPDAALLGPEGPPQEVLDRFRPEFLVMRPALLAHVSPAAVKPFSGNVLAKFGKGAPAPAAAAGSPAPIAGAGPGTAPAVLPSAAGVPARNAAAGAPQGAPTEQDAIAAAEAIVRRRQGVAA